MDRKSAWSTYSPAEMEECNAFAAEYMAFLDAGKTERECVDRLIDQAEGLGYRDIKAVIQEGGSLKAGDKVYASQMGKTLLLYQIGTESMEKGMNLLGAHIDSPRLDIKQRPLYEDSNMAYLDTHYYGGIKKYHWVATPLALHGVIVKKDGTTVVVNIGEAEDDPVFFISDLLPHLGHEQMEKPAAKVIEGEALDLIIGNIPLEGAEKDAVKANALRILKEMYDVEEEDFLSAELEVVPAGKAREVGFDRSIILSYGHDDRVCGYTSAKALLDLADVVTERTMCCILTDKEEIGNHGATGMESRFFENMTAEVMALCGDYSELKLRRCFAGSCMLSSDVTACYDPAYAFAYDKRNASMLGDGVVFSKYTGARGKGGANDANAEFLAHIRNIMTDSGVNYQMAELGKVDVGGGGTISYLMGAYCMHVIDCGVPVLNMHAPWEAVSKADVFEAVKCYRRFLLKAQM